MAIVYKCNWGQVTNTVNAELSDAANVLRTIEEQNAARACIWEEANAYLQQQVKTMCYCLEQLVAAKESRKDVQMVDAVSYFQMPLPMIPRWQRQLNDAIQSGQYMLNHTRSWRSCSRSHPSTQIQSSRQRADQSRRARSRSLAASRTTASVSQGGTTPLATSQAGASGPVGIPWSTQPRTETSFPSFVGGGSDSDEYEQSHTGQSPPQNPLQDSPVPDAVAAFQNACHRVQAARSHQRE